MEEGINFSELCHFQPKQIEATNLADTHQFFLYGGSRGPGKSYWLRWYLLRELLQLARKGIYNANVGLFCENYPTLSDRQISKIEIEFPKWLGELKDSKRAGLGYYLKPEYGGGVIMLRNLDDSSKYQSSEFAAIGIDELTKNDWGIFDILRGSLRWVGVEKPKFVAATNPGGKSHAMVRKIWIDRQFPPSLKSLENEFYFLPALPTDNKYLSKSYWEMLESIQDERLKRAWRYGDWNAFEGQFFNFDEETQLIEPFEIPAGWNLIAGLDPGYSSPCSFSISAIDYEKNIYRIATYYESRRTPSEHAEGIYHFIKNLKFTKGRVPRMIMTDPSAFYKKDRYAIVSNELSFADVFIQFKLNLIKSANDRINGWWMLKDLMARKDKRVVNDKEVEIPKYYVFKYMNKPYIDQLVSVVGDEKKPEDIDGLGNDPNVEDHCLDEERYKITAIYQPRKVVEDTRPKWLKKLNEKISKFDFNNDFMRV